jgi:beta-phosphoglucomutase
MERFEPKAARRGLPNRIDALLYDFDDTIVESERLNDTLFAEVLAEDFGVPLSRAERDLLHGLSWAGVFAWIAENKGLVTTREEVWKLFTARKTRLLETRRLRVATGIEKMLALPVAHAIVSGSTRAEVALMMENIGMAASAARFLICDEDVQKGKPDPEGYRMALARLGVAAGNAVVFEDSLPGLRAARAAGIVAVFVAELAAHDNAAHADVCVASFAEAWPLVRDRIPGARG